MQIMVKIGIGRQVIEKICGDSTETIKDILSAKDIFWGKTQPLKKSRRNRINVPAEIQDSIFMPETVDEDDHVML